MPNYVQRQMCVLLPPPGSKTFFIAFITPEGTMHGVECVVSNETCRLPYDDFEKRIVRAAVYQVRANTGDDAPLILRHG